MNKKSTSYATSCPTCNKPLLKKSGVTCDRCKKPTAKCSICLLPVKGTYAWCQGCGHGGHSDHLREWFASNQACPTGCGHLCHFERAQEGHHHQHNQQHQAESTLGEAQKRAPQSLSAPPTPQPAHISASQDANRAMLMSSNG